MPYYKGKSRNYGGYGYKKNFYWKKVYKKRY